MNLEELRTVQSKERQTDSLQHLRPSFYREVGEYIGQLEDERERAAERADDPFSSPEVARLTDEIESAKDVVEAIYERRMGKLVKGASLVAAGMPADEDGLTAEEQALFVDLVDRIEANKSRVLEVLDGGEPADDPNPSPTGDPDVPPADGPARSDNPQPATDAVRSGTHQPADDPARSGTTAVDSSEGPGSPPDAVGSAASGETGPSPTPAGDDGRSADDGIDAAEAMGAPRRTESAAPLSGSESADTTSGSESAGTTSGAEPIGDGSGDESAGTVPEPGSVDAPGSEPIGDGSGIGRRTVRIVRDVGSILGVDDREYTLESDDVVTLPESNAAPLIDRDAAEPLE